MNSGSKQNGDHSPENSSGPGTGSNSAQHTPSKSANSEGHPNAVQNDWDRSDVCRDYLKNVCSRGTRCKFFHPPDVERPKNRDEINFCIDYQNRGCRRDACRYVHATREDAERYKRTGEVSLQLACAIAAITVKDNINGIPFCKEYKVGKCMRGQRCRYWHVDPEAEKERRIRGAAPGAPAVVPQGGPMGGPGNMGPPPPHTQHPQHMGAPVAVPRPAPPHMQQPLDPWNRHDPRDDYVTRGATGGPTPYGGATSVYADTGARFDDRKRPRYDEAPQVPMGHAPGVPVAGATLGAERSSRDAAYIAELERSNAELRKENDSLARELTRERERYEDLYALFRQHQHQASAALQSAAHTAQSALVQQQQSQQAPPGVTQQGGPSQPQAQPPPGPLGPPVGVGVAVSMAPASMAGPVSAMTSMSNPDVAVHWSTVQMR